MEAVPIVVFWCVAVWGLFRPKQVLLYLLFASLPLGSFAVVPTSWVGGFNLVPATALAVLLIARQLASGRGLTRMLDIALQPSAALLMFMFWVIAGIATLFMPRFFGGQVQIISLASSELMALRPTSQNISQFVYVSISVIAAFAFADMLHGAPARRWVTTALCVGAAVTILTGFLDYTSQYLGTDAFLELFRNANYALLTDDEVLDNKRVVGLTPEASVFGTMTLGFLASLYFFRRAMPRGPLRDRLVPLLMALLLLLVWLSTSSAAYLSLGVFAVAAMMEWCWRALAASRNAYLRQDLASEFWLCVAGLCLVVAVILAAPRLLEPMQRMLDTILVQKSQSSSYEERTMWTRVSWEALLATHGMGVGLGATRASNFAVTLTSNVGLLGAAAYFLFVVQCMVMRRLPHADAQGQALLSAIRWSFLPSFVASLTIGTTPDFGILNSFLYGFSVALVYRASHGVTRLACATPAAARSIAGPPRLAPDRGFRLD